MVSPIWRFHHTMCPSGDLTNSIYLWETLHISCHYINCSSHVYIYIYIYVSVCVLIRSAAMARSTFCILKINYSCKPIVNVSSLFIIFFHINVCVFVYMYIYIYIYTHLYPHTHVHTHTHTHIYIYIYIYIFIFLDHFLNDCSKQIPVNLLFGKLVVLCLYYLFLLMKNKKWFTIKQYHFQSMKLQYLTTLKFILVWSSNKRNSTARENLSSKEFVI